MGRTATPADTGDGRRVGPPLGWWRRWSLRARLTGAATIVIAAALGAAAVFLAVELRSGLIATAESNAVQRLDETVGVLRAAGVNGPIPPSHDTDVVIQVVGSHGQLLAGSPGADRGPLFAFRAPAGRTVVRTAPRLAVSNTADSYRVAAQETTIGGTKVTVYAAVPADDAADSVDTLVKALLVGLPAVLAVLAAITWQLVGRALGPVEALRRQAAEITATDLHRRLDLPLSRDEIYRLARTLNDLLARLDSATRRQREFVADAAHELRSPIASLHTQLEVAAADPDAALPAGDLVDLLADTARLTRLVDDLLRLARLDAHPRLRQRPVDLDDLVLTEARRARDHRGVAIDTGEVSAGQVLGDTDALTRVVHNLLENATRHASSQVTVTLRTGRDPRLRHRDYHDEEAEVVLVVTDDGPGVPDDDRERIFARFTRLDDGRHLEGAEANGKGAGLGLAIVRQVITAHGGTVRVTGNDDGTSGARFEVRLPAADPAPTR